MQAIAAARNELRRQTHCRLSRQDMEDIIQEAFVRLYSRDDSAGPVANVEAFIRRTVRNLLYDRVRASAIPEVPCDEALTGHADETASPERILLGRQAWEAVVRELERLPETTRTQFLQHRLGSVTVRELAQQYQIPRSTMYEQIRNVMDRLNRAARPYL
ncbi:MAG TPA: sigma-70 family RNA polymerase sigma factor [Pedomonas sp.]|uniref:RNA polymerase sigma factor n=1 Tax=Pedomonas sp. TaxID=2976421 RepID=UPI002F427BDA